MTEVKTHYSNLPADMDDIVGAEILFNRLSVSRFKSI